MIQLCNITKSFDNRQVLKGVNLNIKKGEIFGLIGKNGAGKTTLLTIIAGLANATSGSCFINGNSISKNNGYGRLGYLPDVPEFFGYMSACEYIDFLYKGEKGFREKRNELLRLVKIDGKKKIKTMSRGTRQRLGLAATLVNTPDVILLDEPSSALDPMGRFELSEILLMLKEQGKTIILSTHILTDMEKICDRVGFLNGGAIVKVLSPREQEGSQKIRIVFADPVEKSFINAIPFETLVEKDNILLVSGDLQDLELQKIFLKELYTLDNTIVRVDVLGTDLDTVFREVCS